MPLLRWLKIEVTRWRLGIDHTVTPTENLIFNLMTTELEIGMVTVDSLVERPIILKFKSNGGFQFPQSGFNCGVEMEYILYSTEIGVDQSDR